MLSDGEPRTSAQEAIMAPVPHRVLLVEDSPAMRSYVAAALEADYEITPVESGFQALQALPQGHFDLVISDVHMPDINGLELAKFMRSSPTYRKVPLILISTEGSDRDVGRGLELGANAYLSKPFSPAALRELVKRFVET